MNIGDFELDKIYLGDAYELIKKIPDKSIDLIVTDPPYQFTAGGIGKCELSKRALRSKIETYSLDTEITKHNLSNGYISGGGCFGTKNRNYHSQINDTDITMAHKKYEEYIKVNGKDEKAEGLRIAANTKRVADNIRFVSNGISNEILEEFCRIMKYIYIYIWCSKNQLRQLLDFFEDKGCYIDVLTWHKTNPIPTCNGTYLSDTEYCVLARESGTKIYGTYETKKKWWVSKCNVADKKLYSHPTIKPLEIIKNLIINSSKENDVVLDAFMGSGTTAVACKELNRHFIGFELNPEIYSNSIKRLNEKDLFSFQGEENGN